MIIVKTEKGEYKYKIWQWRLAWVIVWLMGVITGGCLFKIFVNLN